MRIVKVQRSTRHRTASFTGRLRGLSRVKGDFHARFLGGGAAAMPPRYPALRSGERLMRKVRQQHVFCMELQNE